jgi:GT2 family glycosyltransferase
MERPPSVSVIICSRQSDLLKRCIASLRERTRYADWEIVVVQHTAGAGGERKRFVGPAECTVLPYSGQFNFARMNNMGAAVSQGDLLIFLNDDVEPIGANWMTCMAAQLVREEVGAVGPALLYPSGFIQHAGIVVGMSDGAGHVGRGLTPDGCELWPWLSFSRNVCAVTGACLGMRKPVFEHLGGMDTAFPNNYNDVDLCLRAAQAGLATIYEPHALLWHKECATRTGGTTFEERELFHTRWDPIRSGDPYYHPSLRLDTEAVMLRFAANPAEQARASRVHGPAALPQGKS